MNSGFVPDQPKNSVDVPYFDDVTKDAGWQGQTTMKSIDTLRAEITSAVARLGGMIVGFQKGTFQTDKGVMREGFRIHYTVEVHEGDKSRMIPGRLDIAALPVREHAKRYRSIDRRREQSLKMALYMLREAIDGQWFLQQLSPGYAPLMPFMLADGEHTISQKWLEKMDSSHLLTSGDDVFEGEVKEV